MLETSSPDRILIVDDHSLFAYTVSIALSQNGIEVQQCAVEPHTTREDILTTASQFRPDLVVLDLHLGTLGNARSLISPLSAKGAEIVVVTGDTDHYEIAGCIADGAACVLGKDISFEVFVSTIIRVLDGETVVALSRREELIDLWRSHELSKRLALEPFNHLTPREEEVLGALVAGKSAEVIADTYFMSVATVRSHIHAVLNKLQVKSQLEAVAKAAQNEWSPTAASGKITAG